MVFIIKMHVNHRFESRAPKQEHEGARAHSRPCNPSNWDAVVLGIDLEKLENLSFQKIIPDFFMDHSMILL